MACKCGCEARAAEDRARKEQRFYLYLRAQGQRLTDAEVAREDALNAKYGPVKEAIQLAVRS